MYAKRIALSSLTITAFLLGSCGGEEEISQEEQQQLRHEKQKEADLALFMESMDDCRLPWLSDAEALHANAVTKFAEEKLPSLGARWKQIRKEYNLTMLVIRLLEDKRARLLEITALEDTPVDMNSAGAYLKVLEQLKNNARMLRFQHERIAPKADVFFAENAVRDVWGDEEISDVNELIKSTDEILEITKMGIDMTLKDSAGDEGADGNNE